MKSIFFKILALPVLLSCLLSDVAFGMQHVGSKRKTVGDAVQATAVVVEAASEDVQEPKLKRDRRALEVHQQTQQESGVENKKDEQPAIKAEKEEKDAGRKDPKEAKEVQSVQPAATVVAAAATNMPTKRMHALIQRLSIMLKEAKDYNAATSRRSCLLQQAAPAAQPMSHSGGSSSSFSAIVSPSLRSDVPRASITPPTVSVSPAVPVASSVAQSSDDQALIKRVEEQRTMDLLLGEVKAQLLMGFYIASQVSYRYEDVDGFIEPTETVDILLLVALDWINESIYMAKKDDAFLKALMGALYAVYVTTASLVGGDAECKDVESIACIKELLTFIHRERAAEIISLPFRGQEEVLTVVSPSLETLQRIIAVNKQNLLVVLSMFNTCPAASTAIENPRILNQLENFDPLYYAKRAALLAIDPTLWNKRVELEVMIKQLLESRYDGDVFDALYDVMKTRWYKMYKASRRQMSYVVRYAASCSNIDIEHELSLIKCLGTKRVPIDQQNPLKAYNVFVNLVTGANFLTDHRILLPAACNKLLSDVIKCNDLKAAQEICALMEQGSLAIDPAQQKTINDMVLARQLDQEVQASYAVFMQQQVLASATS